MSNQVFIGLGSNISPRHDFIKKALKYIEETGMSLIKLSHFYETEPVGGIVQGKFINAAAQIQTTFKPEELIKIFKGIEKKLGRDLKAPKWGPRQIDLDILIYQDKIISENELIIPHPLMHTRRFVLEPLTEIAPGLQHPVLKQTVMELLSSLPAVQ
ncbi:MAG: 2-amino-4-hydroxy-6-hydroxymethyldihydropteridine diphosphokinase [Candidatus Omnitrophica bacterium]|nr:2-amino-4-hydroxy-6-hydroxymethyldihydropteridine diphosphokinase [Candidatus Omnitrophota bacterium]